MYVNYFSPFLLSLFCYLVAKVTRGAREVFASVRSRARWAVGTIPFTALPCFRGGGYSAASLTRVLLLCFFVSRTG